MIPLSLIGLVFCKILVVEIVIFIFFFVDDFINLHDIIQKVILTEYPSSRNWFWLHFNNMRLGVVDFNWNFLKFCLFDLLNRLLNNIFYFSSNHMINLGDFINYILFF